MAKLGKWSDEEIQFLKFAYPNKDFTTKEICEALNRTTEQIHKKASELKIRKYKENIQEGLKRCAKCKTVLKIEMFPGKTKKHCWCNQCHKEYKEYRKKVSNTEVSNTEVSNTEVSNTEVKKCSYCGKIKSLNDFQRRSSTKDGYNASCKECRKKIYEKSKIKKLKERGW